MPSEAPIEATPTPWRALVAAVGWYAMAVLLSVVMILLEQAGLLPRGLGGALALLATPLVLLVPALRTGGAAGWLRAPSAGLGRVALAFLAVIAANLVLIRLLQVPVADLRGGAAAGPEPFALLRFLAIALVAPVAEELFFRGWLWARLSRAWPPRWVALITGLAFAAAHAQYALSILPAAAALSWLRLQGGLRAPMALHLVINTLAAAITLAAR